MAARSSPAPQTQPPGPGRPACVQGGCHGQVRASGPCSPGCLAFTPGSAARGGGQLLASFWGPQSWLPPSFSPFLLVAAPAGCLLQPGGQVCRHGQGADAAAHAADGGPAGHPDAVPHPALQPLQCLRPGREWPQQTCFCLPWGPESALGGWLRLSLHLVSAQGVCLSAHLSASPPVSLTQGPILTTTEPPGINRALSPSRTPTLN